MIHQHYSVSVKDAIQAGRMNLRYIPSAIVLITLAVYFLVFLNIVGVAKNLRQFNGNFSLFLIPVGSFFVAFLWRSFHSTAWKIWALEHVKDVHRLYQVAVSKSMINKRDSWLNKLEYKTTEQRQRLAELEKRLDEPRQVEEPTLFGENGAREIKYSAKFALIQIGFLLAVIAFIGGTTGAFQFFPFGILILFMVGFQVYVWAPRIGKPAPIRFDDTTLTIKDNPPLSWRNITNIYLEKRKQGKSNVTFLVVETNTNPHLVEMEASDLEGSNDDMEQILYDYWVRGK